MMIKIKELSIPNALMEQIVSEALANHGVDLELENMLQLIDFQLKIEVHLGNYINKKLMNEHQANNLQRSIRYTVKKAD
jgi:hypothetical protein